MIIQLQLFLKVEHQIFSLNWFKKKKVSIWVYFEKWKQKHWLKTLYVKDKCCDMMFDDSLWNWSVGELLMTDRDVSDWTGPAVLCCLTADDTTTAHVCVCLLHNPPHSEFKGAICKILAKTSCWLVLLTGSADWFFCDLYCLWFCFFAVSSRKTDQ